MVTTNEIHVDSTVWGPTDSNDMGSLGGNKAFEIHHATFKEHTLLMLVLNQLPLEHIMLVKDINFVDDETELKKDVDYHGDPCRMTQDGIITLLHEEHNENFEEAVVQEIGQVVLYQYLRHNEFDEVFYVLVHIPALETKIYDYRISSFIRAYEDYLFNPETLKKDYPEVYQWMQTYVFHGKNYSLPNEWIKPRRLPETFTKKGRSKKVIKPMLEEDVPF